MLALVKYCILKISEDKTSVIIGFNFKNTWSYGTPCKYPDLFIFKFEYVGVV